MNPSAGCRVLAAVPELFLTPKVAAAKVSGVELELVPPQRAATRMTQAPSALAILDLHTEDAIARDMRTVAVLGIDDDRDPDAPAFNIPNLRVRKRRARH